MMNQVRSAPDKRRGLEEAGSPFCSNFAANSLTPPVFFALNCSSGLNFFLNGLVSIDDLTGATTGSVLAGIQGTFDFPLIVFCADDATGGKRVVLEIGGGGGGALVSIGILRWTGLGQGELLTEEMLRFVERVETVVRSGGGEWGRSASELEE